MTLEVLNKEFKFVGRFSFRSHRERLKPSFSFSGQTTGRLENIAFSDTGDRLFVHDADARKLFQYNLTTPFDLESASFSGNIFDASGALSNARGFAFSESGDRLYICRQQDSSGTFDPGVVQFGLGSAFDLSSSISQQTFLKIAPTGSFGATHSVGFSTDGTRMTTVSRAGSNPRQIVSFTLSSAFDIGTATRQSFSDLDSRANQTGLAFSADGTGLFLCDGSASPGQFDLNTPFDAASRVQAPGPAATLDVSAVTSDTRGLAFSNSGESIFILDNSNNSIVEFSLGRVVPT